MKSISVKEARLLEQRANTTLAWVRWGDILQYEKDKEVILKAWDELWKSELYKAVWGDIEKKANELVEEKCKPEWNKISEEMKPLGEKANELEKEKAWWSWDNEKQAELDELHKKMSELSNDYQKVTDDANKELEEYKDKRIEEEQWGCFFLEDDEYETIGAYVGWILPKVE